MKLGYFKSAVIIASIVTCSNVALAADLTPRTCNSISLSTHHGSLPAGGSGGTGHELIAPSDGIGGTGNTLPPGGIGGNGVEAANQSGGIGGTSNTLPPGGIGGTGIEAANELGGIGGTGNTPIIPPGGIGGTGITVAGSINKIQGKVLVSTSGSDARVLADGDEICVGDKVVLADSSKAKITFTDGATLHVLHNSEISIDDYHYAANSKAQGRSKISLIKGDIRSISGEISKSNPEQYAISTPVSTIRVVGTDFLVTHLPENNESALNGTYVKVLSGEVNVISAFSKVLLRAGESGHVLLNGIHSIIKSVGGTCIP